MHTAFSKEYDHADKAVIFIHGFMGSPDQFADLAVAVYTGGCSYTSVLLPGHSVCAHEFVKFGLSDWEQHIQNEIEKIRDKYKKLYLVGHSMGGLLALNASLDIKNKIAGVFLISTPLKINFLRLKSLLSRVHFLTYPKDHEIKSTYLKSNSITNINLFSCPFFMKPALNFYKLVRKTKKHLKEISVPVHMINSKNDEVTSCESIRLLYDGLCNTQRIAFLIDKSLHAFYLHDERETIIEKLLDFIKL